MLNVAKMDLYRILHSHLPGILLLFLLVLFLADSKYLAPAAPEPSRQQTQEAASTAVSAGLRSRGLTESQLERALSSAPDLLSTGNYLPVLFLTLYVPLFMSAEYRHGFLRNIAGQVRSRRALVLGRGCPWPS